MMGRVLRWAVLIALAGMLTGQVTELFDHWDHTLRTGREADYTLVVLAACAGLEIVLARVLAQFLDCLAAEESFSGEHFACAARLISPEIAVLGPSPPPLLSSFRI